MEADQLQAVELNRYPPVGTTSVEIETRVIRRIPSNHSIAFADANLDLFPDHLSRSPRVDANVNAGTDLHEPDRETPSQPRWRIDDDDIDHRVVILDGRDRPSASPGSRPVGRLQEPQEPAGHQKPASPR